MSNLNPEMQFRGNARKTRMTYIEFLDQSPMTGFLWKLLIGLCLAQLLDGLNFQATSFALPGIIKQFNLDPAQAGLIPSITNIGLAIGAIFFSALCDEIGRRLVFQWVLVTYAFGTCLSAIAPNYHTLLVGQFIAGLGIGAQFPIVMAILAEYSPVKLRHIFVPIGPIFYGIGWIVVGFLAIWLIPIFGWRVIYLVGIPPAAITIFVRYFLPESIRFLLARGQVEEAGTIANDLALRAGMTNVELVPPVMPENPAKMSLGQQLGYLRIAWVPMTILSFFYFCYFIQTFGMNAWLPTLFMRHGFTLTKSFNYSMMIYAATPVALVIAIWFQDRVNRKWALFIMTMGSMAFFILFGMSFERHWPVPILVGSQVLQTLFSGLVGILYTLSSELFPTRVRTLGMGIVNGVGRLGAVLGPFVLGLFLKFSTSISDIIYMFAVPPIIGAIVVVLAIKVDPRGKTLEQIDSAAEKELSARAATNC